MSTRMVDENDPACQIIARRAVELNITANPDKAAHNLGEVTLADGNKVMSHVVHAVDAIITDGEKVVMIKRRNDPGAGMPALPGGFIDPVKGAVEDAAQAAIREAMEEVGVELQGGVLIGKRLVDRPHDVRIAFSDLPQYGIAKGDVFMVSTQGVLFNVPDLRTTKLEAGDDAVAGSARMVDIKTLSRADVGIPDHYDIIMEALMTARKF